jgi:Mg2+-importing ATPase
MPSTTSVLPRSSAPRRGGGAPVSVRLLKAAREDTAATLLDLNTTRAGLTGDEAQRRLEEHGANSVAHDEGPGRLHLLLKGLLNPLVVLLAVLAAVSLATGDSRAAVVMGLMVVLGVTFASSRRPRPTRRRGPCGR